MASLEQAKALRDQGLTYMETARRLGISTAALSRLLYPPAQPKQENRRPRSPGLRLMDYSDNELLHVVEDVADNDGWASSEDIARQLGVTRDHARNCVSSRFSWMRRYGWLERHPDVPLWRVTEMGLSLMNGKISAPVARALEKMTPGDQVLITRALAQLADGAQESARTMLRREWKRNVELRR